MPTRSVKAFPADAHLKPGPDPGRPTIPEINILESEEGLVITGEVSVAWQEDISAVITGETLVVKVLPDTDDGSTHYFYAPPHIDFEKIEASYSVGVLGIRIPLRVASALPLVSGRQLARAASNASETAQAAREHVISISSDLPRRPVASPLVFPHIPQPNELSILGRKMLEEDDRIITKEGERYIPISLAAELAQAPRTTLLNWIKAKVKFHGRPLQVYDSKTARKLYLSEDSVRRVAERFLKLPSKKPAGAVLIGETNNESGYIGISKAARIIGVDHHTMWLWATGQGTAPSNQELDVIKCSATDLLYIRERDIAEMKKLVPRSGLRRGRRPRADAQPT